jgi:hypothetical protein
MITKKGTPWAKNGVGYIVIKAKKTVKRLSRARIELATFGYLLALSKITVGSMRPTS